jgi:hypothetical protein
VASREARALTIAMGWKLDIDRTGTATLANGLAAARIGAIIRLNMVTMNQYEGKFCLSHTHTVIDTLSSRIGFYERTLMEI